MPKPPSVLSHVGNEVRTVGTELTAKATGDVIRLQWYVAALAYGTGLVH